MGHSRARLRRPAPKHWNQRSTAQADRQAGVLISAFNRAFNRALKRAAWPDDEGDREGRDAR